MTTSGIHIDPYISEVFELLHRMESCRTLDPFQWMAREAIEKLRQYESRVRDQDINGGIHGNH
ncbi:hypothetical protein L0Z11_11385 [Burkholderia multivorans]|uniref:hypothetical protein n=1 Tax=Burkholderia multivorans TaxID=87883 RepID=UPI00201881AF|nr:hypothetical protein [Burkholderia multivorans]UQN68288.1 hypothetical protein L0Z45_11405 [Burkholderia multivorans]UQN74017.1 hypothetical protein L0Z11_11385 [Burkholderia multivorans]